MKLINYHSEKKREYNLLRIFAFYQTSLNPMASLSSIISWTVVSNCALDFHPPDVFRSKKIVTILAEDVSLATNKFNCALIAQILGDNSCLNEVKEFAEAKWNDLGLLEVQKLDNELFIFRFQSEESKNKALEESMVFYGSKMMYLRPWVPNKPVEKLALNYVPIWIKLPGLGLQYFTLQALSKLGSLIGRPLFADKDTIAQSRLSYARMCVEIKADEELPNVIIFKNEFGVQIVQDVKYEWIPSRCSFCKLFGHDTNLCTENCVLDLESNGKSHDEKNELMEINFENEEVDEEVDEEAFSEVEERSEDDKILLPKKTRILKNKACPCGSQKKYRACCGLVIPGRSSCNDEGGAQEKTSVMPEEKKISRNEACPCGSEKKYKRCCGSSCKEKNSRNKACPCGSTKKYKQCCGSAANSKQKNSRNKTCHCGSSKKYKQCCGSVAGDLPMIVEEWVYCT